MSTSGTVNRLSKLHLLFLGPPGSGKGTQCKRLKAELGLVHLSTGDLLRNGIEDGKPACLEAKKYIDAGNYVPDDLMIDIFKERLATPDCHHGFILDGFPRTLPQAESLNQMLEELSLSLSAVLYIVVDDQTIIERLVGRLNCSNPNCGAVYHVKNAPPKHSGICDICGSTLKQRSDDKPEVVGERLKVYKELTAPLVQYYQSQGILKEIKGTGSQDEIYANILQNLQSLASAGRHR